MKEFIEKLIERLEEEAVEVFRAPTVNDEPCTGLIPTGDKDIYLSKVIEIVKQLAEEYNQDSTKNNNGWIPCSERLPEVEADILLSLRSLDVYTGFRANTEGCFYVEGEGYVEFENVLAWQSLPEPYKPEEKQGEIQSNFYSERFTR